MYIYYNPNPAGRIVGDCAVRAVAKALNVDWETAYSAIVVNAYLMSDMPSSNSAWGSVLRQHNFKRQNIPEQCPDCYTVADFAEDHPQGTFVLCTGSHAVCVRNGNIYDSWDSSQEIPQFYWFKEM